MDDTHPAIAAKQIELLRAAGPVRRAELTRSMSNAVIDMSRRELARQMPDATPLEIQLRWVELHYGADLASRLRSFLATRG